MIDAMPVLEIRPVTTANWENFTRLFEARGSPHYCWCAAYRVSGGDHLGNAEKSKLIHGLVAHEVPIGVLAYDGDVPVGWCSIAPRETYARLGRSRVLPRVTSADTPTWTVLCFFVAGPYRGRGATHALLRGAISYARASGARVVEGYPFDSGGISSTHRGHSSVFRNAGFRRDGRRWFLELDSA